MCNSALSVVLLLFPPPPPGKFTDQEHGRIEASQTGFQFCAWHPANLFLALSFCFSFALPSERTIANILWFWPGGKEAILCNPAIRKAKWYLASTQKPLGRMGSLNERRTYNGSKALSRRHEFGSAENLQRLNEYSRLAWTLQYHCTTRVCSTVILFLPRAPSLNS